MGLHRNALNLLRRLACIAFACLCVLLASARNAAAQVDEGAITGTVTDTSGAFIPGATVTVLNTDVGLTLKGTTNSRGEYSFSPLRIGNYSVTVEAKGFAKTTQANVTVNVSQTVQANVQLKLGSTSETVDVTTAPPALQTADASVGQVVSERTVNDLPLNGRNFTFLAQLGAGTQTPQADTRGNAASGAFSANGLPPSENNYLLDGIDNNSNAVDFLNGTNFIVLPPVDAISEFQVQTADFSAQLGRSAGAVLNATIKSGTNHIHGAVWEFFRNDKLDAADWFEDNQGIKKGALRQNQFGASIGAPIIKDKIFVFGDYEGLRRVQGTVSTATVPTASEIASGFTNLSDLITAQTNSQTDDLGRSIPIGTVDDPATTRLVTAGQVDPVSGLMAAATGYVRDPFGTCAAGTKTFTLAACNLNQLPAGRIDPVAVKLLSLYPAPTTGSFQTNYASSPNLYEHRNAFDTRVDFDPTQKDQAFLRFSYVDDPDFIPGVFGGIADGGAFQQGIQTALSTQTALGYTHVFTPETVNVLRVGFNHLHTTRDGPVGTQTGIPAAYGIQGIPQFANNGGLPTITIGGLSTLGSNSFLPADEISQTLQITDDFTKIYKSHSFKAGIESQVVKFNTLEPGYSRGDFDFDGTYTDIPTENNGNTGRAQFLLSPAAATVPNGVNYSGGADQVQASNVNTTYDEKIYFASYFEDDWKATNKLTVNLGLRWDYFGPLNETNGGQANFLQTGPGTGVPTFLIPATGKDNRALSTSFTTLLAKDGIALDSTDKYGRGLQETQKTNFAPRVGFAYQVDPKLVVRGGFGIFYNSFENLGYSPNLGENYPFVFNFNYVPEAAAGGASGLQAVSPVSVNTPFAGCPTAGPGGTATIGSGLSCVQFTPLSVDAQGLGLEGLQFKPITPRTLSANLTFQYSITRSLTAQVAYVFTQGRDFEAGVGQNNVTALLPEGTSTTNDANPGAGGTVPFPDFGAGSSYEATVGQSDYNGLQTKIEKQYSNGLSFLFAYTYSKTLSDAGDALNGGSVGGFRAPSVPGLGPHFDWGPADFDIRQVLHFSGTYELPFGKNKRFLNEGKVLNTVIGGWSGNWITTLQGGQPISLSCPTGTTAGTSCNDVRVPGQPQDLGLHTDSLGKLSWFGNPKAFQQPCELGPNGPIPGEPAGCIPLTGDAILGAGPGTTTGPGFHRLDFSLFKAIQINQRFSMQFRAEFFNILNHPNFNAPNFGGNGVVAVPNSGNFNDASFGEIGSTRDAPYDPRQVQFALKLYY